MIMVEISAKKCVVTVKISAEKCIPASDLHVEKCAKTIQYASSKPVLVVISASFTFSHQRTSTFIYILPFGKWCVSIHSINMSSNNGAGGTVCNRNISTSYLARHL